MRRSTLHAERAGLSEGPSPCAHPMAPLSPLGMIAEGFDDAQGRHLGNFPQAFSHLAR